MTLNLHALHVFYVVAHYQSIRLAAEHLYISQPAVSQLIKKLEMTYQVRLLQPAGRGIQLTPLGQTVYDQARPLFDQAAQIEATLAAQDQVPISIAGTQSAMNQLFNTDFVTTVDPTIKLRLRVANTDQIHQQLSQQRLDFALIPEDLKLPGYTQTVVYQDHWVFVAGTRTTDTPTTLAAVVNRPLLIREPGSMTRQALDQVLAGRPLAHPIEVNDHAEALKLVQSGQANYFCAADDVRSLVTGDRPTLRWLDLTDYVPRSRVLYRYAQQRSVTLAAARRCDHLLARFLAH